MSLPECIATLLVDALHVSYTMYGMFAVCIFHTVCCCYDIFDSIKERNAGCGGLG